MVSVDAFTPISTFHELEDSLNQLDFSPTQEIIEKVRYDFITKVNEIQTREVEKAKTALESKRLALEESGRILLAQAGYIHIVRTHQMIDGEDQQLSLSLFGDTDNMIGILRTKKFPYAGLLTFPALDQIRLHPEDRFYQSIRNEQERELKTIEENIKSQARTVLNELVELGKTTLEAGTRPTITVDCFFPTPN